VRSDRLLLLFFAGAACLVACDVVLGLDKFDKCDACPSEAGIEASDDVVVDAPSDAFQLPDGVTEASSWAKWRMENTPYEVDAGASVASLANFDAGTQGIAIDTVTGLTWSLAVGLASTIDGAAKYCAGVLGGSWRVPTRIELATLLDSTTGKAPYITPTFAPAVAAATGVGVNGNIWSSSYVRPVADPLQYWFMSLAFGDMVRLQAGSGGVLCVR
jgi:hypothetical protein